MLQVGGRLLSKRLNQFISNHPWQQRWLLADHDARLAPDYGLSRRLEAPIALWCATHTPPQIAAPWHQLNELPQRITTPVAKLAARLERTWDLPLALHQKPRPLAAGQ